MTTERAELTELWKDRLDIAQATYDAARLRNQSPQWDFGWMASREAYLDRQRTLQAETEALTEYYRVLGLFHNLSLHGIRPPD